MNETFIITGTLHEDKHFYYISLSSSQNEKRFRRNCRENQKTHFMSHKYFPKIVPFMSQGGKTWYSLTGHRLTILYGACALNIG